jgi:hypothetical protein
MTICIFCLCTIFMTYEPAGLSASLRSAANLSAAAHKTSFLLLIT